MEVIISLLIIIIGCLLYVIYRLLDRISFFEDMFNDAARVFFPMGERIKAIMSGGIYSNEPVIEDFVSEMKKINLFLQNLDDEYDMFSEHRENNNEYTR